MLLSLLLLQALPDKALLFDSDRSGNFEIYGMSVKGTMETPLTADPAYDSWWPKPSPDRTQILFVRTPAGVHDTDYRQVSTWLMGADGSNLREILPEGAYGWGLQGHPEWRPDGQRIATMGGSSINAQIFLVDPDGGNPVRVTRTGGGGPRPGTNVDPSWSPDGRFLLFIGCPGAFCLSGGYEVYRVRPDGSGETRLTFNNRQDNDPYYSPDGRTIALLRNTGALRWGIYKMNPDGSNEVPVIDDGGVNSKPAWSLDGTWIYFHRIPPATGGQFNVWKIRPDGSSLIELIQPRPNYVNEYPVNGLN
ncbi:MAG: hypothetical protein EYC70_00985 [Planctomycetota bacterium]|nr:MAG: hypothetical protein EYC70_00985 [Planctomycetota bacterium]